MDSTGKIARCMQQAAVEMGFAPPTELEVKQIIGISLKPALQRLFSIDDDHTASRFAEVYRTHYIEADHTPCRLFDGVETLLQQLAEANVMMAVATGKARRGLSRVWQQTDTAGFFASSRCADEAQSKPHPQMLQDILAELDMHADQAIMVGDTQFDLTMANAANVKAIGVTYGAHAPHQLAECNPLGIVDSVSELSDLVKRLI